MEWVALIAWLAVLAALWALAVPPTAWLLPEQDHVALALPVALAAVGVVGHLVGHLRFGAVAALAGGGVLAVAAGVTYGRLDLDRRVTAEAVAVFLAAFALALAIRIAEPAAGPLPHWIGEKFLDMGLLASLDRSATLPPADHWFAGEPVRYYYGGHMLTALLAAASGTTPALAYNLGLATFYATLVTTAWGVAGSAAALVGAPRRSGAALGAFFVGVAANLETTIRVLLWLVPDGPARWVASGLGLDPAIADWAPGDFSYFDASRVIPVDPTAEDPFYAATEFPLFAWLNGDLHAHMLSQPFTLLVLGLVAAYWASPPEARSRRRLLVLVAIPPVAGLLSLVNLWSFPTAGGIVAVALALSPHDPLDLLPEAAREGALAEVPPGLPKAALDAAIGAVTGAVVLALGVVWSLPFWAGPLLGGPGSIVALWEHQTALGPFLIVVGAFLAVIALALWRWLRVSVADPVLPAAVAVVAVAGFALLGMPVVGVALVAIALPWWLLRFAGRPSTPWPTADSPSLGFVAVPIAGGAGLVLLVEFLTLEGERFNVIFKPYVHVWLLWSVAAGASLAALADGWPADDRATRRALARSGRVLMAVVVLATAVYAGFALVGHLGEPSPVYEEAGPTLDATAYLEVHYPDEAAAIRWLDDRSGQSTILTAAPAGYWWRPDRGEGAAAPASLTGHPTVLGWHHERQYRGTEAYDRRLEHVSELYTGSADRQQELLERYDVDYVYVGPAERNRYPGLTIQHHPTLDQVFDGGDVRIYAVDLE
ncbi:MAG: DUF2298 domain-containing protein [Halobacteriales archaeon]